MLQFFKITTFLWIILTLHSSHTSLFPETVIIKFGGPRAEGRHKGPRAEGREKQIPFLEQNWEKVKLGKNLLKRESPTLG